LKMRYDNIVANNGGCGLCPANNGPDLHRMPREVGQH
jgi:hypothetical protein